MTTNEKLKVIEDKIKVFNDNVLKNKTWKLAFVNKGTNNYCLVFISRKKEVFCGKFDTYGSVMSCLDLLKYMFTRAIKERK